MKVFIASDLRAMVSNGRIYLASQHYYIIKRYHDAFGTCALCCRVLHQNNVEAWIDATDIVEQLIEISSLAYSFSPGFCKKIKSSLAESDIVIARLHSIIGMHALNYAEKHGKKCFAEVMGDAWDAYWNYSLRGKLIAPYAYLLTKKVIWNADYALYVTRTYLQKRFPCKNSSVGVSDVVIDDLDAAVLNRRLNKIASEDYRRVLTLITVGAVNVRHKGQAYVITAIGSLNKAGIRVRYMLVGGGDQTYLRRIAQRCEVTDQVEFCGRQQRTEILRLLDAADIYIQPSLQDGLPRSVVEAMSRGCPVVGTETGGIPELIRPECVVKRRSAKDIADTVVEIMDCGTMASNAKRNYEVAASYQKNNLSEIRNDFFCRIREDKDIT